MNIDKINVGGNLYDVCDTNARAMISDEYNSATQYSAGDYCIWENTLKKANKRTTGTYDHTAWDDTNIGEVVGELNQNMNTTAITATGITCNKGTITVGGYSKIGSLVVMSLRISLSETVNSGDSIIINGFPKSANSGANYIPIDVNVPVANGYMSPDGSITIVADGQAANGTVLIVGGCYISAMNL